MTTKPSLMETVIVTWFGAGLLPKAPGTWGTLAALPFAYGLQILGGQAALAAGAVVTFFVGWVVSDIYQKRLDIHDPSHIVIDEVAGVWITLLAAPPSLAVYAVGFLLFRIFDVFKPWPIGWIDRRVPGGLGVMLDDVLAGLMGAAGLYFIVYMGWI